MATSSSLRRGGTLTWHSEKLGACLKKKFKQFVSVRLIFPGTDMVCVDKVRLQYSFKFCSNVENIRI